MTCYKKFIHLTYEIQLKREVNFKGKILGAKRLNVPKKLYPLQFTPIRYNDSKFVDSDVLFSAADFTHLLKRRFSIWHNLDSFIIALSNSTCF